MVSVNTLVLLQHCRQREGILLDFVHRCQANCSLPVQDDHWWAENTYIWAGWQSQGGHSNTVILLRVMSVDWTGKSGQSVALLTAWQVLSATSSPFVGLTVLNKNRLQRCCINSNLQCLISKRTLRIGTRQFDDPFLNTMFYKAVQQHVWKRDIGAMDLCMLMWYADFAVMCIYLIRFLSLNFLHAVMLCDTCMRRAFLSFYSFYRYFTNYCRNK